MPTNAERADAARDAIFNHTDASSDGLSDSYAADLITNIFHLADEESWDIEKILRMAHQHHEEEK